jgi:Uma2 family endonuclease
MNTQKFAVLKGTWAVVRLGPQEVVPWWALTASGFVSLTRTDEELSVVCPESAVPARHRARPGPEPDPGGRLSFVSTARAPFSERVRALRRVEYEQLVDAGHLANEKVELIRGLIVRMSPQGAQHAAAVQKLTQLLVVALGIPRRAAVRVQLPLALGDHSEPEPDLAAVPPGSYRDEHPTQAFLVIEIAESSLSADRREKGALYAENGIPEYWIVDTARERIEVHCEIVDGAYSRVTPYRRGEVVVSSVLAELKVPVDDVFG